MFAVYQVYLSLIEVLHLIQSTVALTFIQSMIQTEMCSSHSVLSRNFCIKAHGYLYVSWGGGGEGITGYVLSSNRKNAKWIIKHTCAALNDRVKTSLLTLGKEPILKCHVFVQRSQQRYASYALFSHKCNFNLNHSWPENTRF